ncbi:hypothetical protein [Actinoplanes utahensis]|uniref:Uncharacterized protein n=1 Tax=Actinoplanes utahensis TaxID=1869 RepID=A0A0A6XDT3_ACTUT|nr:hypothetical protein [Actinoplanes utahensis]KHD78247.1 hypothetical protein MB27_06930 [Actinoplanes utahensis]GIF30685.1 hypothetical protein Aut01nite_36710 [Actinoplanes utahensis]
MNILEVALGLPEIEELRRRSRALAMCDAILSPEWESRYYSYDSRWRPGEHMASMRNGSGDEYSIVFSPAGAYIRGLDHERGADPGLFDDVPAEFAEHVREPAFSWGANICFWRRSGGDVWHGRGRDDVGWLFELLIDGTPAAYQEFAEDYYEEDVDLEAVAEVFALRPLTDPLVKRLNPDVTVAYLADDIAEIGYPLR